MTAAEARALARAAAAWAAAHAPVPAAILAEAEGDGPAPLTPCQMGAGATAVRIARLRGPRRGGGIVALEVAVHPGGARRLVVESYGEGVPLARWSTLLDPAAVEDIRARMAAEAAS